MCNKKFVNELLDLGFFEFTFSTIMQQWQNYSVQSKNFNYFKSKSSALLFNEYSEHIFIYFF